MSDGETRSLNQIRREAEDARAGLTTAVDQLRSTVKDTATEIRDRLRPDAIKAEVSEYIKSRGEQFVSDVKDATQRNPMQAVAVGASSSLSAFSYGTGNSRSDFDDRRWHLLGRSSESKGGTLPSKPPM